MVPIKKSLKNNQTSKCNTKKQNKKTKMPFAQNLFIPCTTFFPSQGVTTHCVTRLLWSQAVWGQSYVMQRLAEVLSPFLDLLKQY